MALPASAKQTFHVLRSSMELRPGPDEKCTLILETILRNEMHFIFTDVALNIIIYSMIYFDKGAQGAD